MQKSTTPHSTMSNNNDSNEVIEMAQKMADNVEEMGDPYENLTDEEQERMKELYEADRDTREEREMLLTSSAPVVSGPNSNEVKEIDAVDDNHPLVEETGSEALETQTESGAGEFLSDFIYEDDSAWPREWLQNHETANIRAAKLLVRLSNEYPDGWLEQTMWVDEETGETIVEPGDPNHRLADFTDKDAVDIRQISVPRPIEDVLDAASSLGYEPIIEFEVKRDEQEIVTYDNGIGMTPREFDKAFNTIFSSGSGVDGETGGQFGVGSESQALVTGNDGGATVETSSRRPGNHDAFRAYSYLGGANALPGAEMLEDDFKGTRFIMPVCEDFDLSKLQGWIEDYTEKLRVPVKYDEYDSGSHPVDEEYEATSFFDDYEDPAIKIDRPGEFKLVAGPDVIDTGYHSNDEDTFLVSMPIDRNTPVHFRTFWDFVIQIDDEQGRIVDGPNRGLHEDDIDSLHADDIRTPKPTGDRDRLQRSDEANAFFEYIEDEVKAKEMSKVNSIVQEMKDADHAGDVFIDEKGKWQLFKKMVNYHGSRRVTDSSRRLKNFFEKEDELPDIDNEFSQEIYTLFKEIEYCKKSPEYSKKKSSRYERTLGLFLSKHGSENVFMAASTGGNFVDRFRTVNQTYTDAKVIVISGASKYQTWSDAFGFNVLKEVPIKKSDDHDFAVPDGVHERATKVKTNTGKPDEVLDRALKIRTDNSNSSIDLRLDIKDAQDILEDGRRFGGHKKLMLFPRTADENISDNYDMAGFAAIASVSKSEYEELAHYDNVVTKEEYVEWSESALIATEDGAMTPEELVNDDRMVILGFKEAGGERYLKMLSDDHAELRGHYTDDLHRQISWARVLDGFEGGYAGKDKNNVPDIAKPDTLFAVAGNKVLNRAKYAFCRMDFKNHDIIGLKRGYSSPNSYTGIDFTKLSGSAKQYQLKVDTPNWDDDSDAYDMFPSSRDSWKSQVLLGLHDRDIDPSEKDAEEIRELIN